MTLEEAKAVLRDGWKKGVDCPCCGQYVKLYKRKLNAGIAYGLIQLHRKGGDKDFVDIWADNTDPRRWGGDFAKARFWGLAVQLDKDRGDGSKRNGFWKLTETGIRFVRHERRVPKYVYVFNNTRYGSSDEETTIVEALGAAFNYRKLMAGRAEVTSDE